MKKYIKSSFFYFSICIILFSTAGLMSVFLANILKRMIDTSTEKNITQFYHVMILTIFFIVINFTLHILRGFFKAKFLKKVMLSLKHDLFKGIFSKSIKDFNRENTSVYTSIFNNDLKILEKNYFDNLLTIISDLSQFFICLVAVISFQFELAVIIILINVIAIFVPVLLGKILSHKQIDSINKFSDLNVKIKDFFNSFEIIKCFQVTHKVIDDFDHADNIYEESMENFRYCEGIIAGFSTLSSLGVSVMTTLISLYFVIKNQITIGEMMAITQLVNNIANPLGRLSSELPLLKSTKPIELKLQEYMDIKMVQTGIKINGLNQITMDHISFGYTENKEIIHDFSYEFLKNKKYAIVGNSGCGKSTIVKLLLNYYDNYKGNIFINDVNLNEIDMSSVYSHLSMVHQNAPILNDTLRNNITYYNDYSMEQVNQIVREAGLDHFVESLPDGLVTVINENGNNISGGEKQRISIARTLLKNTDLLIYDEPTSNLDHVTAKEVEKNLLNRNNTCIMITHRLEENLLERFDEILVLDHGTLAESGTFNDLLERKGVFYSLYKG